MTEYRRGLRRSLAHPQVYSAAQRTLGADAVRGQVLAKHLKPVAGERILDIGCGPGDILAILPEVAYVGVDISPGYVAAARKRFGSRARFICSDVGGLDLTGEERFDGVMALGVLHHLDDVAAGAMLALAARWLEPGGRFVSVDPGLTPGQSKIARWLIERDRGAHVREPRKYEHLARVHFEMVEVSVYHDLARVPYTHVVLECRAPNSR